MTIQHVVLNGNYYLIGATVYAIAETIENTHYPVACILYEIKQNGIVIVEIGSSEQIEYAEVGSSKQKEYAEILQSALFATYNDCAQKCIEFNNKKEN